MREKFSKFFVWNQFFSHEKNLLVVLQTKSSIEFFEFDFFLFFYFLYKNWALVYSIIIENVQKWDTLLESFTDIKILFFSWYVEKVFSLFSNFFSYFCISKVCKNYFDPTSVTFFVCFEVGNASTAGIDFFDSFFFNFINIFFLQIFANFVI